MADNITTSTTGAAVSQTIAADEVADGSLGTAKVQYVKIMDGTIEGTNKAAVGANGLAVDIKSFPTGGGRTLLFGVINTSSSGDNTLVAAPGTGLKIKVVSYVLVASSAVSVKFTSGAAGTNLCGAMSLSANGGVSACGQVGSHLLEAASNTALVLNLSGAVQVSGHYSYFVE